LDRSGKALSITIASGALLALLLLLATQAFAGRHEASIASEVLTQVEDEGTARVIVFLEQPYRGQPYAEAAAEVGAAVSAASEPLTIVRTFQSFPGFSATVTEAQLAALRADPRVEKVIPDRIATIQLTTSRKVINADDANNITLSGTPLNGSGLAVCVLDTGIDQDHGAFAGRIINQSCFCSIPQDGGEGCCPPGNLNSSGNASDDHGHGSHVSGIAAGSGNVPGIANQAWIVAVKVLNRTGAGSFSDIASGIEYCRNVSSIYNITVISASLGTCAVYNRTTCITDVDSALNLSNQTGIVNVFASGNGGSDTGVAYPACSPYALSVGRTSNDDSIPSGGSCPSGTGNLAPDILSLMAPGTSIVSADNTGGNSSTRTGTSMSTPHVAGAILLLRQAGRLFANENISNSRVIDLLNTTGSNVTRTVYNLSRVDTAAALMRYLFNYTLNRTGNILEKPGFAKVQWLSNVDLSQLGSCSNITQDRVFINGSSCPVYNTTANVTINASFANPSLRVDLLDNGSKVDCPVAGVCENVTVSGANIHFVAVHFTTFLAETTTNLTVNATAATLVFGQNITYNATYVNATSGAFVNASGCTLTDHTGSTAMALVPETRFELNRSYYSGGQKTVNINCSSSNASFSARSGALAVTVRTLPGATINESGSLIENVTGNGTVLNLVNGSFLDCAGFTIIGGNATDTAVVLSNGNTSLRRCTIMNGTVGLRIQSDAAGALIENVTIANASIPIDARSQNFTLNRTFAAFLTVDTAVNTSVNFSGVNATSATSLLAVTLGNNLTRLNLSTAPRLNTTAVITFRNLPYARGTPVYDADDDSVFTPCPQSICTAATYNGQNLTFNVTRWSAFAAAEAVACGSLAVNTTLNANIDANGTCFHVAANDVVLDCAGFTVTGNGTGFGVNVTSRAGFVQQNCTFVNFTSAVFLQNSSAALSNITSNESIVLTDNFNVTINFSSVPIRLVNTSVNASINFSRVNVTNTTVRFSDAVRLRNASVLVNSTLAPALNVTATVEFNGLPWTRAKVLQDPDDDGSGKACSSSICTIFASSGGTLRFNATGFSSYIATENLTLRVSDTTDTTTKTTGQTVRFVGNLTNSTGQPVTTASCSVQFNTGSGFGGFTAMSTISNSSGQFYYLYTSFTTSGSHTFNVSCTQSPEVISLADGFTISSESSGGGGGGTTTTTNATCSDECVANTVECTGLTTKRTCGFFDTDSCLEWGESSCPLGQGCLAGACGCLESWQCHDWGPCEGGTQTRNCTETNGCGTEAQKPAVSQSCGPAPEATGEAVAPPAEPPAAPPPAAEQNITEEKPGILRSILDSIRGFFGLGKEENETVTAVEQNETAQELALPVGILYILRFLVAAVVIAAIVLVAWSQLKARRGKRPPKELPKQKYEPGWKPKPKMAAPAGPMSKATGPGSHELPSKLGFLERIKLPSFLKRKKELKPPEYEGHDVEHEKPEEKKRGKGGDDEMPPPATDIIVDD
jgi:hypothetical protein